MKKMIIFVLSLSSFILAGNPFCSSTEIDDSRDGRCYTTVQIGEQTWMSENLTYRINLPGKTWLVEHIPNYWKIGVFYTWQAAMRACPEGWHLPSEDEWETLFQYVGKKNNHGDAIKKLKTVDGWNSTSEDDTGTDEYGFHAWPVGIVYEDGTYMNVGGTVNFWTSTPKKVAHFPMASSYGGFDFFGNDNGFSVRCIKD